MNALRFITKNILAVVPEQSTTIDWFIDSLVLPLSEPVEVKAGDVIRVAFSYLAGASIQSLEKNMSTMLIWAIG
ncbi:hypothetical protein F6R98_02060 [Candidatus Methylospira mobilis]|uniref:Uncharacterized protein n=1 Tax=Candidatus Methylospira mobilis TaxID=1808979 RepID=A0A5Q0BIA4_9GAMM|nr:hypothetical protein [Candidatus Methylospira mobilis]QFY41556.1 hypothetical protein F6R98_02060 [Candidatus Methylospira mobilis]WNV05204.1 hypothetical protein RP726_02045 [Candidatus Methylospira mobilis]